MAKQTKITIETDSLLILRSRNRDVDGVRSARLKAR
jgi:hypothetical protein